MPRSAAGMRALAVSEEGDVYVALTGDETACGEMGTGGSSDNLVIAL